VAPGVTAGIHNTTPEAAEGIIQGGFRSGLIIAWPQPVHPAVNAVVGSGTKTGGEILIEVPVSQVKCKMFGAMVIE
jgi:hypothetical protein